MTPAEEVEQYERELLHVQGNFPEDKARIADVTAALAKARKAVKASPGYDGLVVPGGDQTDGRVAPHPDPIDGRPGETPGPDAGRGIADDDREPTPPRHAAKRRTARKRRAPAKRAVAPAASAPPTTNAGAEAKKA
jgi:hypothetical protein